MWQAYFTPRSLDQALRLLHERQPAVRIIAGGTDLLPEIERGVRAPVAIIDLSCVPNLDYIYLDDQDYIHLGPLVTHNQVAGSRLCRERAFPLAKACWEVGAPQIRNRATLAGNLATASPANDTITPLWAFDAHITLRSVRGRRVLRCAEFFTGARATALAPDELIEDIAFPALNDHQTGIFLKWGLRRAQAIAVANVAVILTRQDATIVRARITLGSVAPTIIRATAAEQALAGQSLTPAIIARAAELAAAASRPIDDIRGSAAYRRYLVDLLTRQALTALIEGNECAAIPATPVMLWGGTAGHVSVPIDPLPVHSVAGVEPIIVTINGERRAIYGANAKTLLRMLREDAGLIGTKEGCAEGECGACTVLVDGIAVMSCLVPAPYVHGRTVTTIEGLARTGAAGELELHPVQQALIEHGAVQCGYCSPGILMSAAALFAECDHPGCAEIQQALAGNFCRCTGYYAIIRALEAAARR